MSFWNRIGTFGLFTQDLLNAMDCRRENMYKWFKLIPDKNEQFMYFETITVMLVKGMQVIHWIIFITFIVKELKILKNSALNAIDLWDILQLTLVLSNQ